MTYDIYYKSRHIEFYRLYSNCAQSLAAAKEAALRFQAQASKDVTSVVIVGDGKRPEQSWQKIEV